MMTDMDKLHPRNVASEVGSANAQRCSNGKSECGEVVDNCRLPYLSWIT